MRKTTKLFFGFTAGLLLLCGCSAAEEKLGYENADVAKEALASASLIALKSSLKCLQINFALESPTFGIPRL